MESTDLIDDPIARVTYHTTAADFETDGMLRLLYLNGRSVRNKLDDIEFIADSQKFVVHVLAITETWFEPHSIKVYNIPNFNAFHSCRSSKRGGGASIFVRSEIDTVELFSEEYENSSFLVVKLIEQNFHIIAIYRPDDANIENFLKKIENILAKFPNAIIIGDMNLNLLTNNNDIQKYRETIVSNGFTFLNRINIDSATRISTISSIIDHIITDMLTPNYQVALQDISISDQGKSRIIGRLNQKTDFFNKGEHFQ